ncbi:MAG: FixH family protein [Myxococcota bacterium]
MSRAAVALAIGAVGCTGDVTLDADDTGTLHNPNANCDGAETFVAGVSHETPLGRTVAVAEASPTPPDVGDNQWTVTVTDADGAAAALPLKLTPWMPLHGHGLTPPDYAGADEGDGSYVVTPFDLIMPGLWQFTVDLGDDDAAVFLFCAEG